MPLNIATKVQASKVMTRPDLFSTNFTSVTFVEMCKNVVVSVL